MKLLTYMADGVERAGVVDGGDVVDVAGLLGENDAPLLSFVDGDHLARIRSALLGGHAIHRVPIRNTQLAAPIPRPGKVVAIGLNYVDHAKEGAVAMPTEPLVFAKFPTSVIGPGRAITWASGLTDQVDYEAELAVVIGRRAGNVALADALDYVCGYTCLNDVSARDLQFADGQWVRAKSLDTFCPIGPWIVTSDEIGDPQALRIECDVSGETLQDATTADMFFSVRDLIARCSSWFTLEPGDIIATGTPPGVGYFREPRRMLADGDIVTVRIEGIGELVNPVRVITSPVG